jgi:hypothetical protein
MPPPPPNKVKPSLLSHEWLLVDYLHSNNAFHVQAVNQRAYNDMVRSQTCHVSFGPLFMQTENVMPNNR